MLAVMDRITLTLKSGSRSIRTAGRKDHRDREKSVESADRRDSSTADSGCRNDRKE